MLHKIILRLSLTFAALLMVSLLPLNLYKQDILTFMISRALGKPVTLEKVEGFIPFEVKVKSLEIEDLCRLENLEAIFSFDTFGVGHICFKTVKAEKFTLIRPPQTSSQFKIPDFDFLKKLDIKFFQTTLYTEHGEDNKISLKGKLRQGTLFTHMCWHAQQGELTLGENKGIFQGTIGEKPLYMEIFRNQGHFKWQGTFGQDMRAAGTLNQAGLLTLTLLEVKILEDYPLTLLKPLSFELSQPLSIPEAQFSFLHEVLTLKSFSVAKGLQGTLTGEFSKPEFWKTLHSDLGVEGVLMLKTTLTGSLKSPMVTLELHSKRLKHKTIKILKLEQSFIKGLYKDQCLSLTADLQGKHTLKLKGSAEVNFKTSQLKGELTTTLDLKNLKSLLPKNDRIKGQIAGQLNLSGTLSFPLIQGKINLINGYFENYIIGTHLTDIQGSLLLNKNIYSLEMKGKDDFKGTATVKGEGDLFQRSGKMTATLDRFYLGQSDLFTAQVSGHATVDLSQKRVQGTLKAHRVIVDLDQLTPSSTPKIHLIEAQSLEEKPVINAEAPQNEFFLDLVMTPENGVIVRGFGIQSVWEGFMKLYGTKPDFIGEFTLKRGTIDILDRIMTLTRGRITFDHDIDKPYIDIDITKKIQNYKVLVNLKGISVDPKFNFTSDPPLTQEEILGLILMGRKSAAGSIGQLVELSSSLSSLSNHGHENFFSKFRKAFGIEALEIKKLEQNSTSEAPQALSIRKQITPDFTLVIEQGLTSTEDEIKGTRASIEANITENVSGVVDLASDKSGAFGLNWVKRY